jgi:CheY-like chemotaxis protein
MDKLSSLSFLFIDDNRHMLTIVRVLLHAFGVKKIYEGEDASAAFEKFRTTAPDIVIADYQMSPMNGIEFVRMARRSKDSPNSYVPTILLTAHSKRQSVRKPAMPV